MLIRDVQSKNSAMSGRYKWKSGEEYFDPRNDSMGSFDLIDYGSRLEIWSFGIFGKYRGRGYGQQMLKEAIELAGDKKLMLYVEKDNDIALHIYEKAGFQIIGNYGNVAWAMVYADNAAGRLAVEASLCHV